MSDIKKVLISNYMPYAKGVIIGRAIPAIDGLKPVNRRILYTMYKMGLLNGNKTKSANIVGQSMKLHPHGDMAIYEAMVRMTTGNEALNVPYVESKGSFGKVYSDDTQFAAPRYTEAKLADICKELFDGIDEDAVEFNDNYDSTSKEPEVLPVKFPNILVNGNSGIAVGMSTDIPSFGLKQVCDATVGILADKITSAEELVDVLGVPEFSTGGHIHGSRADYIKLAETGTASFTLSGSVELYQDRIVITEIPYNTTIDSIKNAAIALSKSGEIKEIADVRDESDIKGLRAVIDLKRGANPRNVLKKLNRYTNLRKKISFKTRVVIEKDGKVQCVELGLYNLLKEWIDFRMKAVQRVYKYRLSKRLEQEHLLEAWEKIKDRLKEVANYITNNTEEDVRIYFGKEFGMDNIQIDSLLDMKIKEFTKDRLSKKLAELEATRKDIAVFTKIVESDQEKKNIIIAELQTIGNRYGKDKRTISAEPIVEEKESEKEEEIDNTEVTVVVTKRGYIKRLISIKDLTNFKMHEDDQEQWRLMCRNSDHLLVFTYSGMCYKIPVITIDSSKGLPKDYVFNLIEKFDDSEIMYVAASNDYKGSINVVYDSGRGTKVRFSNVSGNRSRYKNVFEGGTRGTVWCTAEDKFFIITRQKKAAYIDLEIVSKLSTRSAFKVARISGDDSIFGIQPLNRVPDKNIDLEKYSRGYCIKIKDTLW